MQGYAKQESSWMCKGMLVGEGMGRGNHYCRAVDLALEVER